MVSNDWLFQDNGFISQDVMDSLHQPIIDLVLTSLPAGGSILDLGCGNGALLQKLHQSNPKIIPFGLEIDPARLKNSNKLLPDFIGNFWVGDMFSCDSPWQGTNYYDLVIFTPGRLIDINQEKLAWFKNHLVLAAKQILVYAYPDWLRHYGTLENIADRVDLVLDSTDGTASLAHFSQKAKFSIRL